MREKVWGEISDFKKIMRKIMDQKPGNAEIGENKLFLLFLAHRGSILSLAR